MSSSVRTLPVEPGQARPWRSLVAIAVGVMMVALDGTIVAVANPAIAEGTHSALGQLQWVTHGYLLGLAVCLITAGKLGDRFGHRRVYFAGVAGFMLASAAIGLSSQIGWVIAFRVVQGVFGAPLIPCAVALLRAAFPARRLNRAIGVFTGLVGASTAAGPILGGVLVSAFSWQAVFFVNVPVAVAALILGVRLLPPNRATDPGSKLDLRSVGLLTPATFGLVLGVVFASVLGWSSPVTIGTAVVGLLMSVAFVRRQFRAAHPLLPMSLFRSMSLSIGTVLTLLLALGLFGALFFLTFYLQNVHGFTPVQAGLQLLPFTLMLATGPLVASHVIDRFGLRVPMFVAMLAAGAAMFGLSTMTGDTSVAWISLWLALLGAGLSLVLVGATDAIVGNAPVRLAGVAGGLQQSAMQLGGSLGTAVLGTLVSGYVGGNLADRLVAAGAARPSAAQIAQWQGEVAQGRPAPVPGLASNLVTAVTRASHDVFLGGVSRAFLISGVVLTIASFPTLFMRRGAVAETTRKGES